MNEKEKRELMETLEKEDKLTTKDLSVLKKHKAKVSLPLYIGSELYFLYTLAVVFSRFVMRIQLPVDILWVAEAVYILLAVMLPFCVKHPDPVMQEESRMMTLLLYSCCLAIMALVLFM